MYPSIWSENLFDDFFGDTFDKHFFGGRDPLYGKHAKNMMKTDVKETSDGYEMDEVNVELENGYLTISAAKGLDKDEQDKEGRYIRQERYAGQCSRSFYIGDVRPENVAAKYEDGILHLTFPKAGQPELPSQKQIAIE